MCVVAVNQIFAVYPDEMMFSKADSLNLMLHFYAIEIVHLEILEIWNSHHESRKKVLPGSKLKQH